VNRGRLTTCGVSEGEVSGVSRGVYTKSSGFENEASDICGVRVTRSNLTCSTPDNILGISQRETNHNLQDVQHYLPNTRSPSQNLEGIGEANFHVTLIACDQH